MTHQVLLGAPYSGQTPSNTTTNPTAEVRHDLVTLSTFTHATHQRKLRTDQLKTEISSQKSVIIRTKAPNW